MNGPLTAPRTGPPAAPLIVVLGSANMDLVATADRLPAPGETVLGRDFVTVPGGKGANQAVAVARAGGRSAFVGAVGTDAFGDTLRAGLRAAGVDDQRVRVAAGPSGVALIVVDAAGENTIVVAPGANATLTAPDPADRGMIAGAAAVICQLEVPVEVVTATAATARAAGVPVVLNAAPARDLPADLVAAVDVLVVNQVEAGVIAGPGPSTVEDMLSALAGVVPMVVLTLGAEGVAFADRDGTRLRVPAPRVSAVDSTAAGDAFVGAFVVAWTGGRSVPDALRWACAAGAVCATRPGASSALPDRADIEALYVATYVTPDPR